MNGEDLKKFTDPKRKSKNGPEPFILPIYSTLIDEASTRWYGIVFPR